MIKIGIDARMYGDAFTGIGRYTYELTKFFFTKTQLHEQKIQWVLFMNEPEFSRFKFPENVKKVCVNSAHYSFDEQTKFLKILNQENCDLVHFMHFNVPYFYRKNYTVTIHDTTLSFYPGSVSKLKQYAYKLVIKNTLSNAQNIVAISQNTKKDIQTLFKVSNKKISVVLNGLTQDFRPISAMEKQQICEKHNIPKEFLFYSGVWKSHKNLKRLFASLKQNNLPLVLTGTPDESLLEYAEKIGVRSQIYTLGKVSFSDLVLLMGAAKIFVFPSLYEGFGLPPLEAMQSETPVISANTSSLPEVCGSAALFFNPVSVSDLSEKIKQLWNDENQRKLLVELGKQQVKKFSWNVCAEETWEVMKKTLVNKNS